MRDTTFDVHVLIRGIDGRLEQFERRAVATGTTISALLILALTGFLVAIGAPLQAHSQILTPAPPLQSRDNFQRLPCCDIVSMDLHQFLPLGADTASIAHQAHGAE